MTTMPSSYQVEALLEVLLEVVVPRTFKALCDFKLNQEVRKPLI